MNDLKLRSGKCRDNVLDRSVFKIQGSALDQKRGFPLLNSNEVRMTSDPVTIPTVHCGRLAVYAAVNGLAAKGAVPETIMPVILLPENTMESVLRRINREIAEVCQEENLRICGGHTEVTGAVNCPIVTVSACGRGMTQKKDYHIPDSRPEDLRILMTRWAGLEGSWILSQSSEIPELDGFSSAFLHTISDFGSFLSVKRDAQIAAENGAMGMINLSEGGVFAGLWKLAKTAGCGFEIELKNIPVRQETIELTNALDINPYEMESAGSLLVLAGKNEAEMICRELRAASIPVRELGCMKDSKACILRNEEEIRYLDSPGEDSLQKYFDNSLRRL